MASTQPSADFINAAMSFLGKDTLSSLFDEVESLLHNEHNIDIGGFIEEELRTYKGDLDNHLPLGHIFQPLLEQVVKKRQKERNHHALQVLIDAFCYKQGYEISYGPRSKWIRENKKRLAEVIRMDEDEVEPFFERYKMVDCGKCEGCIEARAREREGDGGQDARLTKIPNIAEMPIQIISSS